MTPPAAAAAPRTRTRRTAPPPRRVSGTARSRAGAVTTGPPPLALRIGGAVHGLAEHRLLERIIRGRAWIAILGVGLIGIVFMQVSMLRMNAGIGRGVDTATRLERDNAALRATISELSSGDHIETEASKLGLVLPPGTPRFLDARHLDVSRAVSGITQPGHVALTSTTMTATTPDITATQLAPTGVAPSPSTTAVTPAPAPATTATTTPPPATSTAPSTTSTSAPATTSAPTTATAAPVTPTQQSAQPAATAAPPPTGGASPTGQGG